MVDEHKHADGSGQLTQRPRRKGLCVYGFFPWTTQTQQLPGSTGPKEKGGARGPSFILVIPEVETWSFGRDPRSRMPSKN